MVVYLRAEYIMRAGAGAHPQIVLSPFRHAHFASVGSHRDPVPRHNRSQAEWSLIPPGRVALGRPANVAIASGTRQYPFEDEAQSMQREYHAEFPAGRAHFLAL